MPKPVSPERTTEVVANPEHDRRLRRRFSAEDKRRIFEEADACSELRTVERAAASGAAVRTVPKLPPGGRS